MKSYKTPEAYRLQLQSKFHSAFFSEPQCHFTQPKSTYPTTYPPHRSATSALTSSRLHFIDSLLSRTHPSGILLTYKWHPPTFFVNYILAEGTIPEFINSCCSICYSTIRYLVTPLVTRIPTECRHCNGFMTLI